MKQLVVFSILLISSATFAQDKKQTIDDSQKPASPNIQENKIVGANQNEADVLANPRTANNSVRLESREPASLPYNVDDKYMGRAEEFKGLFKTKELPADFPVYEKQYGWGIKEYNAVVGAYLENNKALLTEPVLRKLDKTSK